MSNYFWLVMFFWFLYYLVVLINFPWIWDKLVINVFTCGWICHLSDLFIYQKLIKWLLIPWLIAMVLFSYFYYSVIWKGACLHKNHVYYITSIPLVQIILILLPIHSSVTTLHLLLFFKWLNLVYMIYSIYFHLSLFKRFHDIKSELLYIIAIWALGWPVIFTLFFNRPKLEYKSCN
jgi:hypothetical protein